MPSGRAPYTETGSGALGGPGAARPLTVASPVALSLVLDLPYLLNRLYDVALRP